MASAAPYLVAILLCGQLADEFSHDFRKGPLDDPRLTLWGTDAAGYTRLDQGLRVTLPAKRWPLTPVGVLANLRLQGDFEITAGFEIVDVPEPPKTPGAGVSLYYHFDIEPPIHGSIAWLNGPNVGTRFTGEVVWERPGEKPRTSYNKLATTATLGRLRLQRSDDRLLFFASHGLDEPFHEFHKATVHLADLKHFRFNGTSINQATPSDVRLLDLHVRAAKIDSGAAAAAPAAAPAGSRRLWLVLALCVAFTAFGCGILYWAGRRRKRSQPESTRD